MPYQEVAAKAQAHLERLAYHYSTPAREVQLIGVFKEATRLEADFWEMGWRAAKFGNRQARNLKVIGSNPILATKISRLNQSVSSQRGAFSCSEALPHITDLMHRKVVQYRSFAARRYNQSLRVTVFYMAQCLA